MKKLLILMLVLGMATVANAALSAIPVTDGIVTWDVVGDQIVGYGNAIGLYDGELYPNTGLISPADTDIGTGEGRTVVAGDAAKITADTAFPGGYYTYTIDQIAGISQNQSVGDWFMFDIAWVDSGDGKMYVDVYNASAEWAVVGTLEIIPEPMTIALLGLGGLFLLRRRK